MDPHIDLQQRFAQHAQLVKSTGGYRRPGTGRVHRIFFDESDGEELYPNKSSATRLDFQATYTTPFNGRPGRWGVFHLFSVELGL